MNINDTLTQRSTTHGNFMDNSRISQKLKSVYQTAPNFGRFTTYHQQEALEMIAHKIARILCGNPNEPDHWHDIAGYATLVCQELQKEKQK